MALKMDRNVYRYIKNYYGSPYAAYHPQIIQEKTVGGNILVLVNPLIFPKTRPVCLLFTYLYQGLRTTIATVEC